METGRNIQDAVLSALRRGKSPSTIHMVNGYQINDALIIAFDSFVVLIETGGKQMLLYKHAISSLTPSVRIELNGEQAK